MRLIPIFGRVASVRYVAVVVALAVLVAGCSPGGVSAGGGLRVVAAENFWGSIAAQLAGAKAHVQSIVVNPAQDPHSYEPTSADAVRLATAQLAIVNGVGYDPWAPKLLAANPATGRIVLNVGEQVSPHDGDNPHRWYSPADVNTMAYHITAELSKLDPKHASYYGRRLAFFETRGLAH